MSVVESIAWYVSMTVSVYVYVPTSTCAVSIARSATDSSDAVRRVSPDQVPDERLLATKTHCVMLSSS